MKHRAAQRGRTTKLIRWNFLKLAAPELFALERRRHTDREASVEAPPPDFGVRVLEPDERLLAAGEEHPRLGLGHVPADSGRTDRHEQ
jgi:hypothetical protein